MTLWRILLKGKRRALNHKNETSNNIRIFKRPQPGRKSPTAALLLIQFLSRFSKAVLKSAVFSICRCYPTRCRLSSRILSAIIAMNSLLVGFPRRLWMVQPKQLLRVSTSPLSHATSMAWRMARSTRLAVVPFFLAISGYRRLVTALMYSGSFMVSKMASRRNWYIIGRQ